VNLFVPTGDTFENTYDLKDSLQIIVEKSVDHLEINNLSTRLIPIFFFLPTISASLPKGSTKRAVAKRHNVAVKFNNLVSASRSFPISGRATFNAAPRKELRKEASVGTSNAACFCFFVVVFSIFPDFPTSKEISLLFHREQPNKKPAGF